MKDQVLIYMITRINQEETKGLNALGEVIFAGLVRLHRAADPYL